jgi:serine protease inhibitor
MGIRSVFSLADADLRGIFPKVGGYVASARHVASVSLHEFGADAESLAEAEIEPFGGASSPEYSGGRIVSFIANRPFFWAIRETQGGNLLFLGRFIGPEER